MVNVRFARSSFIRLSSRSILLVEQRLPTARLPLLDDLNDLLTVQRQRYTDAVAAKSNGESLVVGACHVEPQQHLIPSVNLIAIGQALPQVRRRYRPRLLSNDDQSWLMHLVCSARSFSSVSRPRSGDIPPPSDWAPRRETIMRRSDTAPCRRNRGRVAHDDLMTLAAEIEEDAGFYDEGADTDLAVAAELRRRAAAGVRKWPGPKG